MSNKRSRNDDNDDGDDDDYGNDSSKEDVRDQSRYSLCLPTKIRKIEGHNPKNRPVQISVGQKDAVVFCVILEHFGQRIHPITMIMMARTCKGYTPLINCLSPVWKSNQARSAFLFLSTGAYEIEDPHRLRAFLDYISDLLEVQICPPPASLNKVGQDPHLLLGTRLWFYYHTIEAFCAKRVSEPSKKVLCEFLQKWILLGLKDWGLNPVKFCVGEKLEKDCLKSDFRKNFKQSFPKVINLVDGVSFDLDAYVCPGHFQSRDEIPMLNLYGPPELLGHRRQPLENEEGSEGPEHEHLRSLLNPNPPDPNFFYIWLWQNMSDPENGGDPCLKAYPPAIPKGLSFFEIFIREALAGPVEEKKEIEEEEEEKEEEGSSDDDDSDDEEEELSFYLDK
jgi:hypothetical protein